MHSVTTPRLPPAVLHRVQQTGRQHGAGCAYRMAVGDRAAFDIDDVLRELQLALAGERDRGERLVDFDAVDIGHRPSRALLVRPRHRIECWSLRGAVATAR